MKDLTFAVELRPHIGTKVIDGVGVEVEHDQWIVVVGINGGRPKQVGYLPHRTGSPFLALTGVRERVGNWVYEQMEAAIQAERNKPRE